MVYGYGCSLDLSSKLVDLHCLSVDRLERACRRLLMPFDRCLPANLSYTFDVAPGSVNDSRYFDSIGHFVPR